jgi:hypothetical protein
MRACWRSIAAGLLLLAGIGGAGTTHAYPVYGSEDTGIRRLEGARLTQEGEVRGRRLVSGATLSRDQVELHLLGRRDMDLPTPDREFTAELRRLLGSEADRYGLAVLDLSDPAAPRYGEHNGDRARNPGSVGKILVGLALFQALADAWPEDTTARLRVLRESTVIADDFIVSDHHKVRFWDPAARRLSRRPIAIGDEGTLFEYLDWMLSASSNAAAAMVMRDAMLVARFARAYPLPAARASTFFEETPRAELRDLLVRALQQPVTRNGLDLKALRQGSFFTRNGKHKVPGTNSYGTPREMMRLLLRMEQGRLVDEWSSRELKRLLYLTERRIRYASSPALRAAAVYFKSGSLYSCRPEEGFTCRKYQGNRLNLMNSIAVVEAPAGERELFYLVTLNSNVLRKNSAVEHQTLATRIHRLIEKQHAKAH